MTTSPGVSSSRVASTIAPPIFPSLFVIRNALKLDIEVGLYFAGRCGWADATRCKDSSIVCASGSEIPDARFRVAAIECRKYDRRSEIPMSVVTPAVQQRIDAGLRDPEGFWAQAAEALPWFRKWDRAFEWTFPTFRWFIGAQTNLAYNALDHHVASGRGSHTAPIYLNERGEKQSFTFAELLDRVTRTSAALRGLGIRKGDRLTIYMP